MKFPRQITKLSSYGSFLVPQFEVTVDLLCLYRLVSLQKMTHGYLSFIMCRFVAALV